MSQIQGAEIPNTLELESIVTPTSRDALGNCPLRESVRGCPCGPCGPTTRTTFSSASLQPPSQPPSPVTTVLAAYILRPSSPPVISTAQLLPPFTQRPKKSELSGWQLTTSKNFPDEVRKSFSRQKVCVNRFCNKKCA